MRKRNYLSALMLAFLAVLMSGCQTQQRYDYSALERSKPRSILVIPPMNNSIEVDASYVYLSTISKPLAEKGYYVFPVAVIDQFLKENGLPGPAEMHSVPLSKIREHIGADAVLYVTINEWGQKYQVVASSTVVKGEMRLVDARTGEQLWDTRIVGLRQSGDSGGGLAGMLVSAVIEQVVASTVDYTPQVARQANSKAMLGLPAGPYMSAGR